MEQWGNGRANAYWEANLPSHVKKPHPEDNVRVVERYIRDKYEHKKFVAASIPPPNAARAASQAKPEAASSRAAQQQARQAAATARAPAPAAPAPAPKAVDLLDFDSGPTSLAPSQAASAPQQNVFGFAPQQAAAQPQQTLQVGSQSSDGFGEFSGHESHQTHGAPAQPVPQPPQQFIDPFATGQPQHPQVKYYWCVSVVSGQCY